jgi:hypothetical protein
MDRSVSGVVLDFNASRNLGGEMNKKKWLAVLLVALAAVVGAQMQVDIAKNTATGTSASQVQGTAAQAATAVGNPVYVAFLDSGGTAVRAPTVTNQAAEAAAGLGFGLSTDAALKAASSGSAGAPLFSYVPGCNLTKSVTVSAAATTEIIPLSGTTKIRICSFSLSISLAGTAAWVYGTGTNCATGQVALTPAVNLLAGTPWSYGTGLGEVMRGASGNAVCLSAVTGTVNGIVSYVQY